MAVSPIYGWPVVPGNGDSVLGADDRDRFCADLFGPACRTTSD